MKPKVVLVFAAVLLSLAGSNAWAKPVLFWYWTGNLLQNPKASGSGISPWISGGTGSNPPAWSVQSGPAQKTCGSTTLSINSSDGSPWFFVGLGVGGNSSGYYGFKSFTITIYQTVTLSVSPGFFANSSPVFEFGGDAFAEGCASGNAYDPNQPHYVAAVYDAIFKIEFLDAANVVQATAQSGSLFNPLTSCLSVVAAPKTNYGYRMTVGSIPSTTKSVRFTAAITDMVYACQCTTFSGGFKNGVDNLWLRMGYAAAGGPPINSFRKGPAPRRIVKAKLATSRSR